MKNPKVFNAFFVIDEEELTLEEIAGIVESKIKATFKDPNTVNGEWTSMSTGTSYILVPVEAVPLGEKTGIFPNKKEE